MTDFISNLIGNDLLATIIMSIFPLIELKGGIVFARSAEFSFLTSLLLAYLGSTFVFFPIYFLLRPVLNLMKKIKWFNKFALKVENYFDDKARGTVNSEQMPKAKQKNQILLKQLGVFAFVAIPLPMTGVWTGTAIAVFLGLKFKDAILPVVIGNLIAGLIISGLASLCIAVWNIAVLDYILYVLFALAIILLMVFIIKVLTKKSQANKD